MKYLLLTICLLPSIAVGETYFLKKITGKSSSQESKDVIEDLFESELADRGQETLRDPLKAKYHLGIRVIRLGSSHIISVKKRSKGKTLHADKMKASSPDEFDKVVSRLVDAVVDESKAKNNPKIGEVTEKEQNLMIERSETQWYQSYGFGPAFLINHGTAPKKMGYHLSVSKIGEVSPNFALRMTVESTFVFNNLFSSDDNKKSSIDSFSSANFGVNYFFNTNKISPFVTGHLGLGAALGSSIANDTGFVWGGGAGVVFFRTSTTQMVVTLSYSGLINSDLDKNPGQASLFVSLLR